MDRENSENKVIYGLMAEFDEPEQLLKAAESTFASGYRKLDAYTPFPVHGLAEAIGFHKNRMPLIILCGGIIGAISGYSLEYFCAAVTYPLNIGGRPLNSIPAFIPVTFECTVLFAALSAVFGMIFLNGLPLHYHPVFNVKRFAAASKDKFFLCVEALDPKFDRKATAQFLETLQPKGVYEVDE